MRNARVNQFKKALSPRQGQQIDRDSLQKWSSEDTRLIQSACGPKTDALAYSCQEAKNGGISPVCAFPYSIAPPILTKQAYRISGGDVPRHGKRQLTLQCGGHIR